MEIKVTFGQFDTEEGVDYGIVNVWWGNEHVFDVCDCDEFDFHGVVGITKQMTGLSGLGLTKMPFNPYGDGYEWFGYTE